MDETPYDSPDATQKLLEHIAFIRVTHYGGFYDFIPDLAMADTAYTNLALPAHTDTTYFSDPAGLQAFHLLSHKAPPPSSEPAASSSGQNGEVLGGASLLVDGFNAARALRAQDPHAFRVLSSVRLPWHASGNPGINIAPDQRYPVLEVGDGQPGAGEEGHSAVVRRVRWNNDDRGVVPFDGGFDPVEWYDAARKWDSILRSKEMEFWTQLKPGRTLSMFIAAAPTPFRPCPCR